MSKFNDILLKTYKIYSETANITPTNTTMSGATNVSTTQPQPQQQQVQQPQPQQQAKFDPQAYENAVKLVAQFSKDPKAIEILNKYIQQYGGTTSNSGETPKVAQM